MIGGALTRPMRSAAAVGLVVLALALALLVAVAPFAQSRVLREEVAGKRELIAQRERFLTAAAGRPTQGGREALLAGESSGALAAELQRHMTELARHNALSLRSTQVVPAKQEANLTVVGLELSLQGEIAGLRTLLYAVETGVPVLFVEALSIKTSTVGQAAQAAHKAVALDISLKVRGYGVGKEAN
jgi:general secretion pathway protein M